MNYKSVTDYLLEGNSSELLSEEQRYDFLLEYVEEEYLKNLNEEELADLYELVEGIVMKAIGGIARRKAGEAAGAVRAGAGRMGAALNRGGDRVIRRAKDAGKATLRGAGRAINVATLGTGRMIGKGVDRAKAAVGKEIEAQATRARPAAGRPADTAHLAKYKAHKEKQAAKAAKKPGLLGKIGRELDKGFMGTPATDSHVGDSTVYDRVGDILKERKK